jgi:hypothetical protein
LLTALKAEADANDGRLNMSLMTYGYSRTSGTQGFTFGSVVGTIQGCSVLCGNAPIKLVGADSTSPDLESPGLCCQAEEA